MPAINNIVVDKAAEAGYRRRAIANYPNEYLELVLGYIKGTTAYVCAFVPLEQTSNRYLVYYDDEDYEDEAHEARQLKLQVLCSIHSHCGKRHSGYTDPPPSDGDMISQVDTNGEHGALIGICAIDAPACGKKRHKVTIGWWPGSMPLKKTYSTKRTKGTK